MDVSHLDEAGISPTLPNNYGWSPVGERITVPYEAPQGKRVNAVGAYFSDGPSAGRFVFETRAVKPKSKKSGQQQARKVAAQAVVEPEPSPCKLDASLPAIEFGPIDAHVLVKFIWDKVASRPKDADLDWKRPIPLTIILDNYSVHHSALLNAEKAAWAKANIELFYLPPYSPKLSEIEPIWNDTKHHEMQRRSYSSITELKNALDQALTRKANNLINSRKESTKLRCRSA
jgi:transposase